MLETSNDKFLLKSYSDEFYYSNGSGGWNSFMSSSTDGSNSEMTFELNNSIYHIYNNRGALGWWNNYNLSGDGKGYAGTAGNKGTGGDDDKGFNLYRLPRTSFTPADKPSVKYVAAGWEKVTTEEAWGLAGYYYVLLDVTDFSPYYETGMAVTAVSGSLPQYQLSNMENNNQVWTTEAYDGGYAFKSVGVSQYLHYTAPWSGNTTDTPQDGSKFTVSLKDGVWRLVNSRDTDNYLGRWGDSDNGKNGKNDPFAGENLAANKSANNGRRLFMVYSTPSIAGVATELPASGDMAADTWYYLDIPVAGDNYNATATTLDNIVYTTDGTKYVIKDSEITAKFSASDNDLSATRYYVKSSSANNLVIAASSYSYSVGAVTASVADNGIIKPNQEITVTFEHGSNDPSAILTKNFSGVTFGGKAIDIEETADGFTFTVPANATVDTEYVLSIPAGAVSYTGKDASSAAASFTYHTPVIADGWYYFRNTDPNFEYKYISRKGAWATRAGLEDWGLAINVTMADGKYTLQFFDSKQYMYGDGGEVWTDGSEGSANKFTVEKAEGGYKFKYTGNDKYLYAYNGDGQIYKDGVEGNNATGTTNVWALETISKYTASCYARNTAKQVQAAATAASLEGSFTTGAALEAVLIQSKEIEIPEVARQEQFNKHASNNGEGTPYTFFEKTVNGLADGVYKLSFKAMQRAASYSRVDAAEGARGLAYAYANDARTQIVSVMEEGAAEAYSSNYASTRTGLNYPNSESTTYAAFDAGLYNNEIYVYVTGGTLTFGMKTPSRCPNNEASWVVFGDFQLTYLYNLTALASSYETALAAAKTTYAKENNMSANLKTALGTAITTYDEGEVDESSQSALETAIEALTTVTAKCEKSIASYAIIATGSLPNNSVEGWAENNNGDLKVNTWTNTGDNDGSFTQPFIENWHYRDAQLEAGKLYYRLEGLEPGEVYYVEARVRACNEANNAYPNGPTFYVNDSKIDFPSVADSHQDGDWASYFGVVGTHATVGADGILEFGLETTAECNYNWHAVKDVKIMPYETVTIDETKTYTPEAKVAQVTLKRDVKAGNWYSFVVPFNISNADLMEAYGDEVEVAEYSDAGTVDAVTVSFNKIGTPAITANHPVLLKPSKNQTQYVFEDCNITTDAPIVGGTYFDFVGVYVPTTVADGDYFISGNKLYKSSGGTTIACTRAYLKDKGVTEVKALKFVINGEDYPTAIAVVEGAPAENGAIFNLAGQRVGKAQKGVYVVGGKKVVVK